MGLTTLAEFKKLTHNPKNKDFTRIALDDNGKRFFIYIYYTGKRIFYYRTRRGQWVRLGEFTQLFSLAQARARADLLYAQDALSPIDKKELTAKQTRQTYTLRNCYDEFFTQAYKLSGEIGSAEYERAQRRRKNANRHIQKWILQPLGDKLLSELNEQDLINAFTSTKNPPCADTMRKNLSTLSNILAPAERKGIISDCSFIDKARQKLNKILESNSHEPRERATLLDDKNRLDEQKTSELIKCVLGGKMSLNAKLLFAFMMINPQRQNELRHLRASDLTRDKTAIKYHAHNNKTSAQALIPLSPQGRKIIELALKISGGKYIFSINNTPISDNTLNKFIKENGLNFTMHSIRATFATSIQASDELGENSIYRKKLADIIMLHITQSAVDKAYFLEQAKQSELLRVLEFWANKIENLGLDIDYLEREVKDLLNE